MKSVDEGRHDDELGRGKEEALMQNSCCCRPVPRVHSRTLRNVLRPAVVWLAFLFAGAALAADARGDGPVLVLDASGWQSIGPGRSDSLSGTLIPSSVPCTRLSIGFDNAALTDTAGKRLYSIPPVSSSDSGSSAGQILRAMPASAGATVIHFDINEAGLPNQLRGGILDRTSGPANVIADVAANWLKSHPGGTVILRGHSDGTYAMGRVVDLLSTMHKTGKLGTLPAAVLIESPRENYGTWAGRAQKNPDMLFIPITADKDFPRAALLDPGMGNAPSKNWINVNIVDQAPGPPGQTHSQVSQYDLPFREVQIRGYFGGNPVDVSMGTAGETRLGDVVKAVLDNRTSFGSFAAAIAKGHSPHNHPAFVAVLESPERAPGKAMAAELVKAGLSCIEVRQPAASEISKSADLVLKIPNRDREIAPTDNRGFVNRPPAQASDEFVAYIGRFRYEFNSRAAGLDGLIKWASGNPYGGQDGRPVPVWSTSQGRPLTEADIMCDMTKTLLGGLPNEQRRALVLGEGKAADRMVARLQEQGVQAVKVATMGRLVDAQHLARINRAEVVLQVRDSPATATRPDGDNQTPDCSGISALMTAMGESVQLDAERTRRAAGFPPPPPPPPDAVGGVSIGVKVDSSSFQEGKSQELEKMKKGVLDSRPNGESLSWPTSR